MNKRVVITGMGVVSPNGIGLNDFEQALREQASGIRFHPELKDLNFSCQIAGQPPVSENILRENFTSLELKDLKSSGIVYGVISGLEAWRDAGLKLDGEKDVDWDSGIIFGTGILGVDKFREAIHLIDAGKTRRLGSTSVVQTMASGVSAFLNKKIGCGNLVTTNSSACSTGTEAVILAYERIKAGKAIRMLAGSCGESGPYLWGGFDAMRILPHRFNDDPEKASRPMSSTSSGFVPASGAGALVLEERECAIQRGARIYGEVIGGYINSGGQQNKGSMTAPNPQGVRRSIEGALRDAGIKSDEIDTINGHLTATSMDSAEVANWSKVLDRDGKDFPLLNSLKGMTGHCLSAAGSIECVASVLQISKDFVFGNSNCEDLHPDIARIVDRDRIPQKTIDCSVNTLVKASFGFGDVNAVVVFRKHLA